MVGILCLDSLLPPASPTGELFATHAAVALESVRERSRLSMRDDQLREMGETAIGQVHDHRHIVAGDSADRALPETRR